MFSPLCSNLWVHRVVPRVLATRNPSTFGVSSKIGFDEEDHPTSTKGVGTIPLLCTPTINKIAINCTLIDGGAGLNIVSVEVFEKMQVPYHRLMPTRPFFGVTEGSCPQEESPAATSPTEPLS
jgi:hypothetical protein